MQHLINFADKLKKELDIQVVVEPTRAQSPKHIRLAPQKLMLVQTEHFTNSQTDTTAHISQSYKVEIPIILSLRILGGNERFSLTKEALLFSVKLQQFFKFNPLLELDLVEETITPDLKIFGQATVAVVDKKSGEFYRLSEDEESKEARLFLYREDWQLTLITNAIFTYEVPLFKKATFKDTDGNTTMEVEEE